MRVLLDTCVLSEIRHPSGNPEVLASVKELGRTDAFVSVVSIGEIGKGVALLPESNRKRALRSWLNGLLSGYESRILPVDAETATLWGELTASAQQAGFQVGVSDGLIAATAIQHGLKVMTRNVADFEPTGAQIINPWS